MASKEPANLKTPEPEFTIEANDDDSTAMSAMPVTDPGRAPTLDQIQQQTTMAMNDDYPALSPANSTDNMLPPPSNTTSNTTFASQQPVDRSMFGPSGRWTSGVFFCFDKFFTALFWMGCCCSPCLYGQLMQRMNIDVCGRSPPPGRPRVTGTCMTVFWFTAVVYVFAFMGLQGFLMDALFWMLIGYCLFMALLLRNIIRRRFGIGPTWLAACDGGLEDAFLSCCCHCCSAIQMARHTHDEARYPYNGCSTNGLPSYAPDLWEGSLLEDTTMADPAYRSNPPVAHGSQEMVVYPTAASANSNNSQNAKNETGELMTNVEIV